MHYRLKLSANEIMRDRRKHFYKLATPLLFFLTTLSLPEFLLYPAIASAEEATTGDRNPGERFVEEDRLLRLDIHKGYLRERVRRLNTGQFQIAGVYTGSIIIESRPTPEQLQAQLQEELKKHQEALVTHRKNRDRIGEANTLNQIGAIYVRLGENSQSLDYHQQALTVYKQIGDHKGEAETFGYIGNAYFKARQYSKVEDLFRQKLETLRKVADKESEQLILEVMRRYLEKEWGLIAAGGFASSKEIQGRMWERDISWQEVLEISKLNLFVNRVVGDPVSAAKQTYFSLTQSNILHSIGWTYRNLGQYSKALEYLQQALKLQREFSSEPQQLLLVDLGTVYIDLGQYELALEILQNSLLLKQQVCLCHCNALGKIGFIYKELGQYTKAWQYLQQALAISDGDSDRHNILNYIGEVYTQLGKYSKAIEFYRKALEHPPIAGDQNAEGFILNNIGLVHLRIGDYAQAWESYRKALAIFKELNDRPGERTTLSNIGSLLEKQNQPELAIVFYKEAVNVTETIRQGLRELTLQEQEAYTKTIATTYRSLAGLLLKQDRVLEAQRVLDLLKVQELNDYLNNVRGNNNISQGVPKLPPEQQTWTSYEAILNKAVAIGKELTQLRQIKPENRTREQEQRIAQLVKVQQKIVEDFNNFAESPEVLALVEQLSPKVRKGDLVNNLDQLIGLQDNLKNLQQNAVLLYPLILDDRIELILTTPDSPPIRRTVQVSKKQLNETIVAFRSALQNPASDAKIPAQQLYNWLIKPLEADLKTADAKTIIYAPDAQLRYIPLAALHDGQQWLVQRYRINNITAASLTDLNTKPQRQLQVLAGAFATGHYSFNVGGESFDFAGLPSAGVEVENLAKTVPSTTKFIDKAFTPEVTVPKMDDYTVVHLATHAAFVVGTPDDSFILFGNGERITLRDIQKWSLKNVDLVVLSACETGLGGKLGNGEEILGLGYQMQRAGARAAIASLWTVDDGGTQALMDAFYAALESKEVGQDSQPTKAEALRQAQIALITGDYKALGQQRGLGVQQRIQSRLSPRVASNLSHPYYWAPFILIGNGL